MKKVLITALLFCLGGMAWAQETTETEYKMMVGDTVVWKPFDNCDMMSLSRMGGKHVEFKLTGKFFDRVQVIAMSEGESQLKATCGDTEAIAKFTVQVPYVAPIVAKLEKPQTQPFTATYKFNPPTDNFFVTYTDPENHCKETFVKVGDDEAYNDGHGGDRFWNIKTGKNWYYRPDAQGWTDDVDWEFTPFAKSLYPLNAFETEVDKSDLSKYYIGTDKVLDVDCWVFFVDQQDGSVIRYWVDPANGCTLQRQAGTDEPRVVTVYELNYTKLYFGPSFKKSLHDTTR